MSDDPFIIGLRQYFAAHPDLKPATVSARIGDKSTIRKLLDGTVRTPTLATAVKIAEELGLSVEEIIGSNASKPLISVSGQVAAGEPMPLFDASADGGLFRVILPTPLAHMRTAHPIGAVEVSGSSMQPTFNPGDLLFFSRAAHDGVLSEDVGRICIVEDEDGNAWVKQVKIGTQPDLYHLISHNPQAMNRLDQRIKWAARVLLALPSELIERA